MLSNGTQSVALLGYALNPFDPSADNRDVLVDTLSALEDGSDLLDQASVLGGRWVLIVNDGRTMRLFHDAMGLRPVFYTDPRRTRDLWYTSQPAIVAQMLNLPLKSEVIDLVTATRWTDGEHWLPGDAAPYDGMKRLVPNHYLDLRSGESRRYWPTRELGRLDLEESVQRSGRILSGLMESVSRRYSPAIGMTAGRDCRVVLAASRGIRNATYVTVRKPRQPESDVAIPARLLRGLGLAHHIIPWPSQIDEHFATVFRRNSALPHDVWIPEAQACFHYSGLAKVAVTGAGGSAPKRYYAPREEDSRALNPERLSATLGMGSHPFAVASFGAWLAGVADIRCPDAWDLVHWEQRCGGWLAMCQQEYDVAWGEIFTPYNCRRLLAEMMAVETKLRTPPAYALHQAVMRSLWPDVLKEPIPLAPTSSLLRRIRRLGAHAVRSMH
ncbi:MAG TPA: hypothetical protein VJP78_14040 [Thermoleophilia bacterium]|nr:hypothetical protein [Thermoleophilia bacterium]